MGGGGFCLKKLHDRSQIGEILRKFFFAQKVLQPHHNKAFVGLRFYQVDRKNKNNEHCSPT